ncbi:M48 family metallopeptidase [Allohahella marinimesophila]|uniref:M48 family metallopeptidase n=1 Tax=Allohahella marinimesophila TaxID=1054972 RepID=A0ABP7PIA3_9GAMM
MKPGLLFIATMLSLLTACQESPSGRSQLALLPDSMMDELGQEAFAEMKRQQPVETSPAVNAYVQCVAGHVIDAAVRVYPPESMPESWEVVVFDDPQPNAFALPGGKIGVHTGMLRLAQTPDQLAAVIGHEVAHVLADHGNERMTQQLGIQSVLYVVGFFSEGEGQRLLMEALGIGSQLGIALPFSRAHEREADLLGLNIMASAGFEPQQSVNLWRNMAAAAGGQPLEFLSTHPAHETRIERLQEEMEVALKLYQAATPASCAG